MQVDGWAGLKLYAHFIIDQIVRKNKETYFKNMNERYYSFEWNTKSYHVQLWNFTQNLI